MSLYIYKDMQAIQVSGKDCSTFLQGQLTNDLNKLNKQNNLQLNSLCDLKGRVLSLFFIHYVEENELIITLPSNIADTILSELRKYAVFSKVNFNTTINYHLIYTNEDHDSEDIKWLHQHSIICTDKLEKINVDQSITEDEVKKANICQQLPFIDINNTGCFLPAELNFDNLDVVSYDKGCFKGQEIIARMKYRGKLKKILLSIKVPQSSYTPDKLSNSHGKTIANVVNAISINNNTYMLIVSTVSGNEINLDNDKTAQIIS